MDNKEKKEIPQEEVKAETKKWYEKVRDWVAKNKNAQYLAGRCGFATLDKFVEYVSLKAMQGAVKIIDGVNLVGKVVGVDTKTMGLHGKEMEYNIKTQLDIAKKMDEATVYLDPSKSFIKDERVISALLKKEINDATVYAKQQAPYAEIRSAKELGLKEDNNIKFTVDKNGNPIYVVKYKEKRDEMDRVNYETTQLNKSMQGQNNSKYQFVAANKSMECPNNKMKNAGKTAGELKQEMKSLSDKYDRVNSDLREAKMDKNKERVKELEKEAKEIESEMQKKGEQIDRAQEREKQINNSQQRSR